MKSRRVLAAAAIALFVVGLVFVRFDPGGAVPAISAAFVVILALPSYVALWRWLGTRKAMGILVVFSVLPLLVEGFGVATGFPYGSFSYAGTLGEPLFGLVPWTVSFAYLPIFLGAVTLAGRIAGTQWQRFIPATALFVVAVDLVIDPAAVVAGFWVWEHPGLYYGIPAVNFLGWALTGTIYGTLFFLAVRDRFEHGEPVPMSVAGSMILILSFWSGYLLREFLVIPVLVGWGLIGLTAYVWMQTGSRPGDG